MALAFATRAVRESYTSRSKKIRITSITLDASYVNGTGWAVTKAQLGFGANDTIDFVDFMEPASGFKFIITISATGIVIRAYTTGSGAGNALQEAANNLAGLNGLVIRVRAEGN